MRTFGKCVTRRLLPEPQIDMKIQVQRCNLQFIIINVTVGSYSTELFIA